MAEVMNVPRQPGSHSYYQSSSLRRSSPSSSSLFMDHSPGRTSPALSPTSKPVDYMPHLIPHCDLSDLPPSSREPSFLPPTPSTSSSTSALSDLSPPVYPSSIPMASRTGGPTFETELDFPNYDDAPVGGNIMSSVDAPPSSPAFGENFGDDNAMDTDTTPSDSPLPTPTVADDSDIKVVPSRQVDFLSHEWREEDIWSSWRHIVSQRKTVYGERSRLENASWRSWAKHKFDLRTVPPESLNWLKESDVTWLYGPLKTASSYPVSKNVSEPESQLSKSNSFIAKKPILKKRSMSEVMLQRSISTSSLVKQAADRIQAQGRYARRSGSHSSVVDSKLQSETPSRDQIEYFTSRSTSTSETPCEPQEKRHIRFDERVEQCIAVELKDSSADLYDESDDEGDDNAHHHNSDSSSDDGVVMMKRSKSHGQQKKKSKIDKAPGSRRNSLSGPKTIETLPATTLKYRTDSPDITAEAQHHTFGRSWVSGKLSPSPSQETLRPSHPSSNFLIPHDEYDEDVDSDSSWSFGSSNPKSSLGASADGRSAGFSIEGMRRTNSGMFMPEDDQDEDDIVAQGLFGRVTETINTARDIAHVIWNVGWRS